MATMKIGFSKDYIESYQMSRVKEDAQSFKEAYQVGDLLREFKSQTGEFFGVSPEIVRTTIIAMDSGWYWGNVTIFSVEMLLDDDLAMYKVRFYIDMELTVDTREIEPDIKMYDVKRYERV